MEVRVGIATGPVVVGDIIGGGASEEAAALGETPNLAARLQGAASPNFMLLSPTTQRLLRGRVETQTLAPVNLKGLSGPIVPHRALRPLSLSEVSSAHFDSSPLVGRRRAKLNDYPSNQVIVGLRRYRIGYTAPRIT